MHEEILKNPLIVRCLGKLEGYTIYEAKADFAPFDKGVTIYAPDIKRNVWDKVIEELTTKKDRKHLPKNIFLHEFQISSLMKWAEGLLVPLDEDGLVRCADCKGGGWYTGIVKRYHCPTCDGAGKVSP